VLLRRKGFERLVIFGGKPRDLMMIWGYHGDIAEEEYEWM